MRLRLRLGAYLLPLLLLAGLAHGLLYLWLMPPWQHYDEPNHFEYAWLLANHPGLPHKGDVDTGMRAAVGESMLAHNFFAANPRQPDKIRLFWARSYSQLDERPFYYLLASLPLRFLQEAPIETQLYAARSVSLLLFLLTILAAWGIARELTRPGSALRWMLPLALVMLPAFVDLMTAVNNDVAAVAVFSYFLWGCVRLLKRFSLLNLAWVLAAVLLGYFTKSTTLIALPLALAALLIAGLRGRLRLLSWALLGGVLLAGSLLAFSGSDAAFWYRHTPQAASTRQALPTAPLGQYALRLDYPSKVAPAWLPPLQQLLPVEQARRLSGKTVTVGAWMWATRPLQARTPILQNYSGGQIFSYPVELSQTPSFHAFTATLTGDPFRTWISLAPLKDDKQAPVSVFYDGLVVVEGTFPLANTPRFSDASGQTGEWGGRPFTNLLRDASAESAWPHFRPWVDQLAIRIFSDFAVNRPSVAFYTLLDWPSAGWYYQTSAERLFRTFWATFGWGHVPFAFGRHPYRFLAWVSLIGVLGAVLALFRRRRSLPWGILAFFALTLVAVWGITLVRGSNYLLVHWPVYFPVARYTYPAVIPTLLLLVVGWREMLDLLARGLHAPIWGKAAVFVLFFLGLDVLSLLSIIRFYSFF